MYRQKIREKKNIPSGAGRFLRKEIDSTDFENENLTTKIRRNKEAKLYFFKKFCKRSPNRPNYKRKQVPKKVLDKEINQIK